MKLMGRYLNVKGLGEHSVQLSLSYVLSLRHTRYFILSIIFDEIIEKCMSFTLYNNRLLIQLRLNDVLS